MTLTWIIFRRPEIPTETFICHWNPGGVDPSDLTKTIKKMWAFPKIVVPQNGWFIMENPIKVDDLGVPLFSETSMWLPNSCALWQLWGRDWSIIDIIDLIWSSFSQVEQTWTTHVLYSLVPLPKTNISSENRPSRKGNSACNFQPSIFRDYSFREGNSSAF